MKNAPKNENCLTDKNMAIRSDRTKNERKNKERKKVPKSLQHLNLNAIIV
jgi:hypothetical protein